MFYEASVFSGDLSSWDISSVATMAGSEYAAAMLVSVLWVGCGGGCVWNVQGARDGLVFFATAHLALLLCNGKKDLS